RFAITDGGAGGEQQLNYSGQNLPLDEWSLVTITVADDQATMYIDGAPVASNDSLTTVPADLGITDQNWIGKSQYGADPAFDGAVDDFAIYSRALSSEEVAAMATGESVEGDVLHYAFDEEDGTTVLDSSGSGNDGEITVAAGSSGGTTATDEETADRFWTLERTEPSEPGAEPWDAEAVYLAGDRVTYEGALFEATWWNRGQEPGDSPYSSWQEMSQTPDGMVIWTSSRIFTTGEVVVHEGQEYTAKWWTRNQEPGDPHGPWELSE